MKYLLIAIAVIISLYLSIKFTILLFGIVIIYLAYKEYYFKSESFMVLKDDIKEYTEKCNELNDHIEYLKESFGEIKMINYGVGELIDNSSYNFKRPEWAKKKQKLICL